MKPSTPVFDSEWRSRCVVVPCSIRDVNEFVRRHYLGKRPGVTVLAMMMMEDAFACGMITYSLPPSQTSVRYGGVTWEMSRLFIEDRIPANGETWLIAQSVRYIRKNCPTVRMLVTYADPSVGHQGVIYRAANWTYDGHTDADRKTPKFDLVDSAGKKFGRASHVPVGTLTTRLPRVSKARFIYRLSA